MIPLLSRRIQCFFCGNWYLPPTFMRHICKEMEDQHDVG